MRHGPIDSARVQTLVKRPTAGFAKRHPACRQLLERERPWMRREARNGGWPVDRPRLDDVIGRLVAA